MKATAFWKYWFPPIFGLLIYFTIRLLLDSVTGMRFWRRPLTIVEILYCVLLSYLLIACLNRLFRYFDKRWAAEFSYRRIARELCWVFVFNLIFQNLFLTTFVALTDDGLQWYDLADINIIPLLYVLIYYGIMRSRSYLNSYVNSKVQLEKIMNDKLETELKFLKAQYHPHFLFNALNTIYFQMDENVGDAKRSVEKFSELLRYQLYDQQQTVPVQQELHYLQNYIELQEVRSSDKLKLSVQFDQTLNGELIYPLLLLPLVENAFKYVGGEYWIRIGCRAEGRDLHFTVDNAVPSVAPQIRNGGIGLENLRRRLQLLYPGKHRLELGKTGDAFHAVLTLQEIR